jgi:hypothetical protein
MPVAEAAVGIVVHGSDLSDIPDIFITKAASKVLDVPGRTRRTSVIFTA